MKKVIIILILVVPFAARSQSNLFNRFKQKVKAKAEQRVDEGMDKTIDKAEEEITKKPEAAEEKEEKSDATEKATPATTEARTEKQKVSSLQTYSRYDFIPGERIIYTEDFSQDAVGEFPLKWVTNNRGETVTIESLSNKWMRLFPGSQFASPAMKSLPENFTVDLDMLLQFKGEGGYVYPGIDVRLSQLTATDANARNYVTNRTVANEVALVLAPGGADKPLSASVESIEKETDYFRSPVNETKALSDNNGKPFHVSIWVQKERIRYWLNGDKIFDIPQAVPANSAFTRLGFGVATTNYNDEEFGIYVSNIKIAEGTPDMRTKLITEGKLVTNGILFDVNSDKIKPESAGVLKEIATVLKDNPNVKVKIVGHTDNDGDAGKNIDLSRRRAVSVKNALSGEYNIEPSRISTDGFGASKPVADNATKEGKAKNRRVEFIKL